MGLPELAKLFAATERSNLLMLGILLILAGLLFKIAAVPFHVWTPDVYEGSPTPVTAFFSVGPEARGLRDPGAHLLRRLSEVPRGLGPDRRARLGRDDDLRQRRRAPADQRQADAGLLVDRATRATRCWASSASGRSSGLWGILVYLLAYTFMNFGAFTLVIFLETQGLRGRVGLGLQRPRPAQHAGRDRDARSSSCRSRGSRRRPASSASTTSSRRR